MRIDKEDYKNFTTLLDDYIDVCCEIAIEGERLEILGLTHDINILKDRLSYYSNKGNKHNIKFFKINENYTEEELSEYIYEYLEDKIQNELRNQINLMVQYPNTKY